mmetsp:Transcript_18483/g.54943  ORF Transcript_18483/g.54943 Transcript_18483/m.54943 type:complete len:228 (+) Transcript_18483:147-830(+)
MRLAAHRVRRRLVHPQEHGKGHDEVDAVEGRAHGVGHVPIFKRVVGEARDRERLEEGREVRHRADRPDPEPEAPRARLVARVDAPERGVREHVVEAKVEVRREVHGDGHVVQSPGGHGVRGPQHAVEVVRVPVVAHKSENTQPDVRLERVAVRERPVRLLGERRVDDRLQDERRREAPAHEEVGGGAEALVQLEADDGRERADPDDGVGQEPDFRGALGRILLGREP